MLFTDFNHDKKSKIIIDGTTFSFSDRIASHKSAWPNLIKNQLKYIGYENVQISPECESYDCDIFIIDHGMEYKGGNSFNIFGGASDELAKKLLKVKKCIDTPWVSTYSMYWEMPNLGELIKGRYKTGTDFFKTLIPEEFEKTCSLVKKLDNIFPNNEKFIFGDSHSLSMYEPGSNISRNDGLTLWGSLQLDWTKIIPKETKELTLYFGNIDIRHHLCRFDNPVFKVNELVSLYENKIKSLNIEKIQIIEALPIENESRKLPKTGYYKDTPFYGTWKQRDFIKNVFNDKLSNMCLTNNWKLYKHPSIYLNTIGELDFNVMEKPKSVHLSREFYRYNFETNEEQKFDQHIPSIIEKEKPTEINPKKTIYNNYELF